MNILVRVEAELSADPEFVEPVPGADLLIIPGRADIDAPINALTFKELSRREGAIVIGTDGDGRAEFPTSDGPLAVVLRVPQLAAPSRPGGTVTVRPQYLVLGDVRLSEQTQCIRIPASQWRDLKRRADVWTVVGRVLGRANRPAAGLVVEAFDADLLDHDELGRAFTDANGVFRIDFQERDFQRAPIGPGEIIGGPDLFFRVATVGGQQLLRERAMRGHVPDRANAGAVAVVELCVDLEIPDREAAGQGGPRGAQRRHDFYAGRWKGPGVDKTGDWWKSHRAAIASMRAPNPEDDDPGAYTSLRVLGEGSIAETTSPTESLSHGQASTFVRIETKRPEVIQVPLEPQRIAHLDPSSLHLFQWSEATSQWLLIERSGLGSDGTYVFGRVSESGVYGVFGLPRDQARLVVLEMLSQATRLFPLSDAAKLVRTDLPRRVAGSVLTPALVASGLLDDPLQLAAIGLPDEVGDLGALLGRPLGDLPRDAKGKPIGEPEGYPAPMFLLGGLPGGGLPGGGLPGGLGGGRGGPRGWEPGDPICPDEWWRFPELQIIVKKRPDRWGIPGGSIPRFPVCGCSEWESVGPSNVPGRMKSIAWHPTNANIVYCSATGGGVYRSNNRGVDWRPIMFGELSLTMGAIALAPSRPDTIYAGTGEYHSWGAWGGSTLSGVGVYRSTDGGVDWDLMPAGASTRVSAVVVDANDPDRVFVAGNNGVHRYDAANRRWVQILASECSDLIAHPSSPARLYAAIEGGDGIVTTADARAATVTWTAFNTGVTRPSRVPNYGKLAICRSNPSILYLSINADPPATVTVNIWFSTSCRVYRYDGTSWVDRGLHGGTTYGGWTNAIAVSPTNADHVLVGATGLEESTDGGAGWASRGAGHADQQALVFCPTDSLLSLLANDGGMWRRDSSTGNDYLVSNRGLATTELYNVCVSRTGAFRIGGSTQDNGVIKSDGPVTYVGMGGNEGGLFEVDPNDSRIIYWDPWSGNLTRTTTGQGAGGVAATTGMTANADGTIPSISALAVKRGDSQTVVAAAEGGVVYRSTNGATGWTTVANAGASVNRFAWAPSQAARVYFVTDAGRVFRSDDSGANFTAVSNNTLPVGNLVGLAVDWDDADIVYVTFAGVGIGRGHVFRSTNAGVAWEDVSGARNYSRLPDIGFYAIAQRRGFPETLFAASDLGVFVTRDGGDWWYPYDEGLPNALVTDMDYAETTDTLYLSTSSRGFWKRSVT